MGKELVVKCGKCGKRLKTDVRFVGRSANCPKCGSKIRIEADGDASPVAEQTVRDAGEGMLSVSKQNDVGIVHFTTSRILDQSNVQQLSEEFDALLEEYKLQKLVLNFQGVGYMSSAVMGRLNVLRKRVEDAGGKMRLCNIDDNIYEIFKIMKFTKLFRICDNEDQAVIQLMD